MWHLLVALVEGADDDDDDAAADENVSLRVSQKALTLLLTQSSSIWVGLSLHICLKLNTALLLDIPPAGTLARSFSSIMYNLVLVDCCHPRRVQTLSWQRSACKFHHSAPAQTRYGKFTVDLLDRLVRMSFK